MAEGGYDLEIDPMGDARNYPLPENYDRDIGETSFSNLGFDDGTQILTGETSNLTGPTFTTPIRPRPETIEPFSGKGNFKLLAGGSLLGQKIDYTIIGDKLRDALAGTNWSYTNTGINKLAPRIELHGKDIYYAPEQWEIEDMTDKQRGRLDKKTNPDGSFTYIVLLTKNGKFYAERTLSKLGTIITNRIKKVLNMPEEDEDDIGGIVGRMSRRVAQTKGTSEEAQIKEAHDIFQEYLKGGFEYPPSRREPQAANNNFPEYNKLIVKQLNPEQFLKEFFALPQDELTQIGITPEIVREAESGITLSVDLAAKMNVEIVDLKKQRDDLKHFFKELEKKLTDTGADNFILEVPLKDEIKELKAEIKELDDTIDKKDKKITELWTRITME